MNARAAILETKIFFAIQTIAPVLFASVHICVTRCFENRLMAVCSLLLGFLVDDDISCTKRAFTNLLSYQVFVRARRGRRGGHCLTRHRKQRSQTVRFQKELNGEAFSGTEQKKSMTPNFLRRLCLHAYRDRAKPVDVKIVRVDVDGLIFACSVNPALIHGR